MSLSSLGKDRPYDLLSVTNVSKSFSIEGRSAAVLDSITVTIPKFSLFSIFGPNGCGKSTLLGIMAGLIEADTGSVCRSFNTTDVGIVFQDYSRSLMPWRTCLDNIALPLEATNTARGDARDQARSLIEELGFSLPVSNYPYQLSGGQRQITCIARALVRQPALMLLDEPFASLDFEARRSLRLIIQEIHQRKAVTTVFVSHELEEAIALADYIAILSRRPSRIVHIFPIALQRPRTQDVIASGEYIYLRKAILEVVDREFNLEEV